ncbi:M81 family metallopeptidase [Thalassobius sp. Cn5-15]|uniref:M81 family metallopeptidase n=1 Tax=Thalassobius sp. Cn5-15 TaxID=2917763 RepID=UPI001EF3CCE6|nr:M81 family metallopeptidase [Thalassobius sp. Cn5-15]MCG7492752.1 M81 family metallopeptidase [Thalassobius sp. Cn5-15]
MRKPRVALLGMILESNRFARPANLSDFKNLNWLEGDALLVDARSKTPALAQEFASFVQAMDATGPWQPVPVILAACHPQGPVEEEVFETYAQKALAGLDHTLDAVYLCHHGAMAATHLDDPDGELAARIRTKVGPDVPIVQTLDLHANISDQMCDAVDLICGYRTNPHVDMIERGEETAFALRRILSGHISPQVAHVKLPLVPASVSLLTPSGPYGELIDYGQRRQAELAGAILNVSIFGNFVFSDVPENGVSVVVTARDDLIEAERLATEIADRAWNIRHQFIRQMTSISDAVELARFEQPEPVILSETGDNPGGGGSGRTTALLAALIEARAQGVLYGSFYDPALAAEANRLGVGARFDARFNRSRGDAPWEQWDTPLEVTAEVAALHDGTVTGRLGLTAGRRMKLGPSALLNIGGISVVVISDRTQTADPVFFEMFGLDIADAQTVCVKSRGHFRAGFAPWFTPEQVYEVDTAGLTSPVLENWPFTRLPRPSFPLDPETVWSQGQATSFST